MKEKNLELATKLFGKELRIIRQVEMDKVLEELAEITGLDPSHIAKIERGEKIPRIDTILKLYNAGISIDNILEKVIHALKEEGRDLFND